MADASSPSSHFGGDYVRYWRERVVCSPDGTPASTPDALRSCIPDLDVASGQTILDLGCGFGRMLPLLSGDGRRVLGVDVSAEMIDAASSLPYDALIRGSVEDTRLPAGWVDRILCWATFDVAEQEAGWREFHRILRPGGRVLVTGKNDRYRDDDEPALIAERNAFLKSFPNHFTDVASILASDRAWGFELVSAWGYERRGDMGADRRFDILRETRREFYEYALVLRRLDGSDCEPLIFCDRNSRTMKGVVERSGEGRDLETFLRWHRERYGESFPMEQGALP